MIDPQTTDTPVLDAVNYATRNVPSSDALIWANRFINIGLGRRGTKLCNDRQAECMQVVIDEARQKAMDECIERISRLGLFIGDGDAVRLQVTEAIKALKVKP